MHLDDYDFHLPSEQIAQHPVPERDQSRLLILERMSGALQHCLFQDLPNFLRPEDALVLNETRVFAARLRGRRLETGGRVELLLIRQEGDGCWLAMGKPMKGLRPGTELSLGHGGLLARICERTDGGRVRVEFSPPGANGDAGGDDSGQFASAPIDPIAFGEIPLPPYIRRAAEPSDADRYQTVYSSQPGSVAAPTAGLHFTLPLLERIRQLGVAVASLTLHVGPGTFAPIRCRDPHQHHLEAEFYALAPDEARLLEERRQAGGRIVAVGTTVARVLETCADGDAHLRPGAGWTDLFIHPPHQFRAVDSLVTNFHLPRSSLLMLVSALAGRERMLDAYRVAVEERYRFYSYGDAMLIL